MFIVIRYVTVKRPQLSFAITVTAVPGENDHYYAVRQIGA